MCAEINLTSKEHKVWSIIMTQAKQQSQKECLPSPPTLPLKGMPSSPNPPSQRNAFLPLNPPSQRNAFFPQPSLSKECLLPPTLPLKGMPSPPNPPSQRNAYLPLNPPSQRNAFFPQPSLSKECLLPPNPLSQRNAFHSPQYLPSRRCGGSSEFFPSSRRRCDGCIR